METGNDLRKRREDETCAECRFYISETTQHGYCRRYPPSWQIRGQDAADSEWSFSYTRGDVWCGEWKALYEFG
jgi:hypothetical protein